MNKICFFKLLDLQSFQKPQFLSKDAFVYVFTKQASYKMNKVCFFKLLDLQGFQKPQILSKDVFVYMFSLSGQRTKWTKFVFSTFSTFKAFKSHSFFFFFCLYTFSPSGQLTNWTKLAFSRFSSTMFSENQFSLTKNNIIIFCYKENMTVLHVGGLGPLPTCRHNNYIEYSISERWVKCDKISLLAKFLYYFMYEI